MQVDEPDHHVNTSRVPLALLHQRRPGLAFRMKVSQFHCAKLLNVSSVKMMMMMLKFNTPCVLFG